MVVVYKIDRVKRSLTDFSKLIEVFERNQVSFVAVTQRFNTKRLLDEGRIASGAEIAWQEGLNQSSVNEVLRRTVLSPEMGLALLAGRQPKTLTLRWLKKQEFPVAWAAQREVCGALTKVREEAPGPPAGSQPAASRRALALAFNRGPRPPGARPARQPIRRSADRRGHR